jgi:hypothetical protein
MLLLTIPWASVRIWRSCLGARQRWTALLFALGTLVLATGPVVAQAPQRPAKVGILWYLDPDLAKPYVGAFKAMSRRMLND